MRMCQNDINPLNVMVSQIELFPLSINCLFLLLLFITDLFFSSVFFVRLVTLFLNETTFAEALELPCMVHVLPSFDEYLFLVLCHVNGKLNFKQKENSAGQSVRIHFKDINSIITLLHYITKPTKLYN